MPDAAGAGHTETSAAALPPAPYTFATKQLPQRYPPRATASSGGRDLLARIDELVLLELILPVVQVAVASA